MSVQRRLRAFGLLAVLAACAAWSAESPQPLEKASPDGALVLSIRDAIGPATSSFFLRALREAEDRNARLVILEMDTPGGLETSMRDMIQGVLGSSIPVAIYVSPSGARAASAGTYLLYASHVAAMAPATNLGAATPVQIGGAPPPSQPADKAQDKEGEEAAPQEPGTASERKAMNDSIAYIRGLAELRGRNVEWAESAVRSATSLTATAALEQNVIDIVAVDIPDLLKQMDGRTVQVNNQKITLNTQGLVLERMEADWRTQLLAVITNPNVALLLMMIGVYGLLLEGYNPGAILPGVVGGISLLLALFAFQVLPVNYAGLALIGLGVALMIGEAFAPSFGVLGIGGLLAFVIGAVILMDTDVPGFQIAWPLIAGIALAGGLLLLLTVSYFARSRRQPVITGANQLVNACAVALTDFDGSGPVRLRGEIWNAVARMPVRAGERLRVVRVDGLNVHVEPYADDASQLTVDR